MITLLILIAILVVTFAIFEDYIEDYKWNIFLSIGLILVLMAGLRPVGIDNDSENYEYFYFHNNNPLLEVSVEYSYLLLSKIFRTFTNDVHSIFILYAILGIATKLFAIKKLSSMIFLPIVIYIGNYYIVHDMTQIRAGVASGFCLISIYHLCKKEKGTASLFMLCALFFHYSSLVLFPLLFLSNKEMSLSHRLIWVGLIPFSYIIYFTHINILTTIPIPYLSEKIEAYQYLTERGIGNHDLINVFNLVFLTKIVIFMYLIYFYETILYYNKNITILLQVEAFSIVSFIIFAPLPVLSFRLSDLFGIVDIVLFPNIYYTIKQSMTAKVTVSFIGLILLCINLFYIKLLEI